MQPDALLQRRQLAVGVALDVLRAAVSSFEDLDELARAGIDHDARLDALGSELRGCPALILLALERELARRRAAAAPPVPAPTATPAEAPPAPLVDAQPPPGGAVDGAAAPEKLAAFEMIEDLPYMAPEQSEPAVDERQMTLDQAATSDAYPATRRRLDRELPTAECISATTPNG